MNIVFVFLKLRDANGAEVKVDDIVQDSFDRAKNAYVCQLCQTTVTLITNFVSHLSTHLEGSEDLSCRLSTCPITCSSIAARNRHETSHFAFTCPERGCTHLVTSPDNGTSHAGTHERQNDPTALSKWGCSCKTIANWRFATPNIARTHYRNNPGHTPLEIEDEEEDEKEEEDEDEEEEKVRTSCQRHLQ